VRLPDGRTAWLFGDSFIGGDQQRAGARFVRNAVAVQDGGCLTTILGPDGEAFLPSRAGTVLWPSQAVVDGDVVRAFFTRVRTGTSEWDLTVECSIMVTLSLPDLRPVAQRSLPVHGRLFFGAAVVRQDDGTQLVFGWTTRRTSRTWRASWAASTAAGSTGPGPGGRRGSRTRGRSWTTWSPTS
jgi:hypothetical protein